MDSGRALNDRYSVRDFDFTIHASETTVDRLLGASIRTPSAGNRLPWHYYAVRDASAQKAPAAAAYNQAFLSDAPVTIVVCAIPDQSAARYGRRGREPYALQGTAAAVKNLMLASVALGLGACWIGAFHEQVTANALNPAANQRPISIVLVRNPLERRPVSRPELRQIHNAVTNVA